MISRNLSSHFLLFILLALAIYLPMNSSSANESRDHWQSVFHHGPDGDVISGSKAQLIDAVRKGKQIRIYMNLKFVEHSMDANFLSIFEGEVYAQIDPMKGQLPNRKTKLLELRDNEFNGLYSTNGKYELHWFVHY